MSTSRLELLKDVAQAISATWDVRAAAAISLEVLCEHFHFPAGIVWSPDEKGVLHPSHVFAEEAGLHRELSDAFHGTSCADHDGVLGALLATQALSTTWALDDADDEVSRTLSRLGYAASAAFCVQARGGCAALLQVALPERRRPDAEVLAVIETVAIHLGHVMERVLARDELTEREERTRRIIESSADAFVSVDEQGIVHDWNRRAEELFGWSAEEACGRPITETIADDEVVAGYAMLPESLHTESASFARPIELMLRRRDGTEFTAEAQLWRTDVASGERLLSAFIRDVSEERRQQRELSASREQLAHSQQLARLGSWDFDRRTGQLSWSKQYRANLGIDDDVIATPALFASFLHPDDRERVLAVLDEAERTHEPFSLEYRIVRADGEERRLRAIGRVEAEDGEAVRTWGAVQDITEEYELRRLIQHRSRHDPLTDLASRPTFQDAVQQTVQRLRAPAGVVVALVDLDRFSEVNDQVGTGGGDAAIVAFADRLRTALPEREVTVARTGGDEFGALVVLDEFSPGAVEATATEIQSLLDEPFTLRGVDVPISASIGVSVDVGGEHDADDLLRNADLALNMAKARGGDLCQIFEPQMHEEALAQLALRADLQRAVAEGQIEVYYQPVVSMITGDTVGFEALGRWARPGHGPVSPDVFIPLAEQLGLVGELGLHVLKRACADLARFRAIHASTAKLTVAVNLSAHQLDDPQLVGVVQEALATAGLPAHALVLEVTESTLASDDSKAVERLWELDRLGVRLAIDDFGTGYSSLSRLRDYPAHLLKIDRSFLRDIRTPDDEPAILSALFAMARTLGLSVVAEGVETPAQLAIVLRHSGEEVQGYLFGPPVSADAILHLLADPSWDLDTTTELDRLSDATEPDDDGGMHHQLAVALRALVDDPGPHRLEQVLVALSEATGLASTYLTRIDFGTRTQEVVRAVNTGRIHIPQGLTVQWADALCRRALDEGVAHIEQASRRYPDSAAADLGIDGYLSVPVHDADGAVVGTLCGVYPEERAPRPSCLGLLELTVQTIGPYLDQVS